MPRRGILGTRPKQRTEQEEMAALDEALDEFKNDMRARLYEKVKQGYKGWDDPSIDAHIMKNLYHDVHELVDKGDKLHLHDIANRAMFLWWQEWRLM